MAVSPEGRELAYLLADVLKETRTFTTKLTEACQVFHKTSLKLSDRLESYIMLSSDGRLENGFPCMRHTPQQSTGRFIRGRITKTLAPKEVRDFLVRVFDAYFEKKLESKDRKFSNKSKTRTVYKVRQMLDNAVPGFFLHDYARTFLSHEDRDNAWPLKTEKAAMSKFVQFVMEKKLPLTKALNKRKYEFDDVFKFDPLDALPSAMQATEYPDELDDDDEDDDKVTISNDEPEVSGSEELEWGDEETTEDKKKDASPTSKDRTPRKKPEAKKKRKVVQMADELALEETVTPEPKKKRKVEPKEEPEEESETRQNKTGQKKKFKLVPMGTQLPEETESEGEDEDMDEEESDPNDIKNPPLEISPEEKKALEEVLKSPKRSPTKRTK